MALVEWLVAAGPGFAAVNQLTVDFGTASAFLGNTVSFGVYDSLGNLLVFEDLDPPLLVDIGQPYKFNPGGLVLSTV